MGDTLFIIKPDAVAAGKVGGILSLVEGAGFKIVAQKMMRMSRSVAEEFYGEHRERPFFGSLVLFMTSGPVVMCVLRGDNVVSGLREVLGATDPAKADPGTIRKLYGSNVENNAAHASDSEGSALREVSFFFAKCDIVA